MRIWKINKTPNNPVETAVPAPPPKEVVPPKYVQDDSHRTRNSQVKIRLTKKEVAELKAAARKANMSMADFVMTAVRDRPIVVIDGIPELLQELRKEGTNLNQAMRLANEIHDTRMIPQLQEAIHSVHRAQSEVIGFIQHHEMRLAQVGGEHNGNHD